MKVFDQYFYPAIWTLYNAALSIPSRIAIEIFTFYHAWAQDEKAREIENLSSAIRALENKEKAVDYLAPLVQARTYPLSETNTDQLLVALKAHRYGISALYNGVNKNEDLLCLIYNYINIQNSPSRTTSIVRLPLEKSH